MDYRKSSDYLWVSHLLCMRVCVYLKNITLVEAMFNPKAEERRKKYKRYIRGIWDFILFQEDFFLNNILYFLY